MIVSRDKVRKAYVEALAANGSADHAEAIAAAARALGIAEEAVRDVIESKEPA